MKLLCFIAAAIGALTASAAYAIIVGRDGIVSGNAIGQGEGVLLNQTVAVGTPCTAGAIDLSLATGCNLPFFVGEIFP